MIDIYSALTYMGFVLGFIFTCLVYQVLLEVAENRYDRKELEYLERLGDMDKARYLESKYAFKAFKQRR